MSSDLLGVKGVTRIRRLGEDCFFDDDDDDPKGV